MIDVNDHIAPVDLDQALKVIKSDRQLRREFARLRGHRDQAEHLLRAARVARSIRVSEDGPS